MSDALTVTTIIPTYNGRKLLEKNLPSVLRSLRNGDELIIIDDASQDESCNWLKYGFHLTQQRKPNLSDKHGEFELFQGFVVLKHKRIAITLIENARNLRFAASVNRAVGLATKPLLFLLNSDASVQPDTVDCLVKAYQNNAQPIFAIGCLEYEGEINQDLKSLPTAGKNKLWFERGYFMHSKASTDASGETVWASGGSALFNRERWLALGGFDERFAPAYWEDIDLSYRAKKKGWQVLFERSAVVFHLHESTNQRVFSESEVQQLSWKHAAYFVQKHGSFWQKIAFVLWQPYWLWKRSRQ